MLSKKQRAVLEHCEAWLLAGGDAGGRRFAIDKFRKLVPLPDDGRRAPACETLCCIFGFVACENEELSLSFAGHSAWKELIMPPDWLERPEDYPPRRAARALRSFIDSDGETVTWEN